MYDLSQKLELIYEQLDSPEFLWSESPAGLKLQTSLRTSLLAFEKFADAVAEGLIKQKYD